MNSLRDVVKEVIDRQLKDSDDIDLHGDPIDTVCDIADEIFDILDISEEMQDKPFVQ